MDADHPVLPVSDRSYRYGDGFFETIKVKSGKILLSVLHFERLFSSLKTLKFKTPDYLEKKLSDFAKKMSAFLARE